MFRYGALLELELWASCKSLSSFELCCTQIYDIHYMYQSTEICDETRNHDLKIFFRAHLRGQVFLVVCSIYKRNSRMYSVHRMVYFFQNNFLLFKKMAKSPFHQTSAIKHRNDLLKVSKKKLKLEKKSFRSFFLIKKCWFL